MTADTHKRGFGTNARLPAYPRSLRELACSARSRICAAEPDPSFRQSFFVRKLKFAGRHLASNFEASFCSRKAATTNSMNARVLAGSKVLFG